MAWGAGLLEYADGYLPRLMSKDRSLPSFSDKVFYFAYSLDPGHFLDIRCRLRKREATKIELTEILSAILYARSALVRTERPFVPFIDILWQPL